MRMNRDADKLEDVQWIALCAERLREQWPRADPTSLEEAARDLWMDETLRRLAAREAAEKWLAHLR
jgi:hypothetical protein